MYKRVWTPISNQVLQTRSEPENPTDKYDVCVLKDGKGVGHLKRSSNGRFAKTMQVPCMLELEGQGRYIDVLKQSP